MIYRLPEKISIDGKFYAVNTDFRIWIKIENILFSEKENVFEKLSKALCLCYDETVPETFEKAVSGMMNFYRDGKMREEKKTGGCDMPIVSFSEDAEMISAAFYHDYGINLWSDELHWWKFLALFKGLDESNMIIRIMRWRAVDLQNIKNKEERKFYRKMKEMYRLPDKRTQQMREKDMLEKFNSIF